MYAPGSLPPDVPSYLRRELQSISESMVAPSSSLTLDVLAVAPKKPRNGMLVIADGTNWNPGAGVGVYARIAGAWVKL